MLQPPFQERRMAEVTGAQQIAVKFLRHLLREQSMCTVQYRRCNVTLFRENCVYFRLTLRYVPESSQDKIIADEDVFETLLKTFKALFINDFSRQADILALLPEVKCQYLKLLTVEQKWSEVKSCNHRGQHVFSPEEVLFNTLGFTVSRDRSSLVSAGTGVFVTRGFVPKGTVVSMYPGTVYRKHEPIFFQSLGNPFIFRCIDGVLIDGNDKGLSRSVYRSCSRRDQLGPFQMSDESWLTATLQNPLAVGQYVNNCSHAT
ncbi:SET domain-containing protein 9 isoform X3 [Haemorhous mexicanus]|uniref:SET domain-containing protein 9 isoform X3 n=1 Tax=Haemorhous mexicanus TaxID=30427 RepID=UPI0028BE1699|nr:SET domain-containing protein 9 isoform X3 [Haemorhous mexicanus]